MSEALEAARHGIGGNKPPEPLSMEEIREWLAEETAALAKKKGELLAAMARFQEKHSAPKLDARGEPMLAKDRTPIMVLRIPDPETQAKAADFVKMLATFGSVAEKRRTEEKKPFLDGGREVDAFFARLVADVQGARKTVETAMTAFALELEAERRRIAEEEAKAAAEAANRALQEAARTLEPEALDVAVRASSQADAAIKHAEAKPAEHSRVYGDYGAVASLRTTWKYTEVDKLELLRAIVGTADQKPRLDLLHLVVIDPPAVNRMIAGGKCQSIPGLNVFEDKGIGVR